MNMCWRKKKNQLEDEYSQSLFSSVLLTSVYFVSPMEISSCFVLYLKHTVFKGKEGQPRTTRTLWLENGMHVATNNAMQKYYVYVNMSWRKYGTEYVFWTFYIMTFRRNVRMLSGRSDSRQVVLCKPAPPPAHTHTLCLLTSRSLSTASNIILQLCNLCWL